MKIIKRFIKLLWVLLLIFVCLFFIITCHLSTPSAESTLKLSGGGCVTVLNSHSDGGQDIPPYGNMVFMDKYGCCAAGFFRKYCATQVYGSYCKEIKLSEEPKNTLNIVCEKLSNDSEDAVLELKTWSGVKINHINKEYSDPRK